MAIFPFARLRSNTATVFLGTDREQAALNAANATGDHPDAVARNPLWPSLEKFDNDTSLQSFSPFGGVPNPEYIWDQPTSDSQTVAFATTITFNVFAGELQTFSVFLGAFADNAMQAKIELFESIQGDEDGPYAKVLPQPTGLDEFLLIAGDPNTPAVGLTETQPFNWQDIRMYSTNFTAPTATLIRPRFFRIVVSFEATNYLGFNPNPAVLQFMVDIYRNIEQL